MNKIEINQNSGCCFGVERTIARAEAELERGELCCLGKIVHNDLEMSRLAEKGLVTVSREKFKELENVRVLFRAHGEPPVSYETAEDNNLEVIDTTCPVVLNLQKMIKAKYDELNGAGQIVIYGQKDHAEVIGLAGQTDESAIIVEDKEDLDKIDFTRDTYLFSQTTKPPDDLQEIARLIKINISNEAKFELFDTICQQVANRAADLRQFASWYDLIIFVAGEESSNGQTLFNECKASNPNSYFISQPDQLDPKIIDDGISIGICGATSTPRWQMEAVAQRIAEFNSTSADAAKNLNFLE